MGGLPPVALRLRLRFFGAPRGLVALRCRFRPVFFLDEPAEKRLLRSCCPGAAALRRALPFPPSGRGAFVGRCRAAVFACRFADSAKPAPLFRQALQRPFRFLPLPLGRKTGAAFVLVFAAAAPPLLVLVSPCLLVCAGGLLFFGFPGFLCVRPLGEPYVAGSGIALTRKKRYGRPPACPFFSGDLLTIFIQSVIIWAWLVPTNSDSFCRAQE